MREFDGRAYIYDIAFGFYCSAYAICNFTEPKDYSQV